MESQMIWGGGENYGKFSDYILILNFDKDFTDITGNTEWGVDGSPTISSDKSIVDSSSLQTTYGYLYLKKGQLDLSANFTIESWIYCNVSRTDAVFDINGEILFFQSSNNTHYIYNNGWYGIGAGVSYNKWVHIALIKEDNIYRSYINGELLQTIVIDKNFRIYYPTDQVYIGCRNSYYTFDGYINVLCISNIAKYKDNFIPYPHPLSNKINSKRLYIK